MWQRKFCACRTRQLRCSASVWLADTTASGRICRASRSGRRHCRPKRPGQARTAQARRLGGKKSGHEHGGRSSKRITRNCKHRHRHCHGAVAAAGPAATGGARAAAAAVDAADEQMQRSRCSYNTHSFSGFTNFNATAASSNANKSADASYAPAAAAQLLQIQPAQQPLPIHMNPPSLCSQCSKYQRLLDLQSLSGLCTPRLACFWD